MVDANIPQLYIARVFGPYNRASRLVFRFRSRLVILILMLGADWHRLPAPKATLRAPVQAGIDVYESIPPAAFRGKRLGLITNQTGLDSQGRRTIDVLAQAQGVELVALFSPEHGIAGESVGAKIPDSTDRATELPIYSLYGETRRPTDRMLQGIDVLVFDLQDAGVRFYTFVTTLGYCMEAAAKHHIRFVVMDRPDPLGGEVIEGPMLDSNRTSFTSYFPMPVRYAMTIGELAGLLNVENHIDADLEIFPLSHWNRDQTYDQTGLPWIAPSPNLRTVKEAFLYPGLEILQAGGVSVGRGTPTPFEILGAPWIEAHRFARELNRRKVPGVRFEPAQFTPNEDPYAGKLCGGVRIRLSDPDSFRSMRLGLEIADVLDRMYPSRFKLDRIVALAGSQATVDRLRRGDRPEDIIAGWSADLDKFRRVREKYLLYP